MFDREIQLSPLASLAAAAGGSRPHTPGSGRGGRAKTLNEQQFRKVLSFIDRNSSSPEADRLKILLSFGAGLRVCEISGLQVFDVTEPDGKVGNVIHIRPNATKGGKGRSVPMNREVKHAIHIFRRKYPQLEWLAVSDRKGTIRHQAPNALTVWFRKLYIKVGLEGCSSHSGRRTFITQLARQTGFGGDFTLKDVQKVVGHARLDTTDAYIDSSPHVAKLVDRLSGFLGNKAGRA
jgi:integrase/recombinase XerD